MPSQTGCVKRASAGAIGVREGGLCDRRAVDLSAGTDATTKQRNGRAKPARPFVYTALNVDYRPPSPVNEIPSMKYLWVKKNRISTGSMTIVVAAISSSGLLPWAEL